MAVSQSPLAVELDLGPDVIPLVLEAAICFIVLESIANIAKHARATNVKVKVWVEDQRLVTEIEDDGIGGRNRSQKARRPGSRSRRHDRDRQSAGSRNTDPSRAACRSSAILLVPHGFESRRSRSVSPSARAGPGSGEPRRRVAERMRSWDVDGVTYGGGIMKKTLVLIAVAAVVAGAVVTGAHGTGPVPLSIVMDGT